MIRVVAFRTQKQVDTLCMRDTARELINVSNQLKLWSDVPVAEQDISGAFQDMDALREAFPVGRQRLIKMLIKKIEVRKDGHNITLNQISSILHK